MDESTISAALAPAAQPAEAPMHTITAEQLLQWDPSKESLAAFARRKHEQLYTEADLAAAHREGAEGMRDRCVHACRGLAGADPALTIEECCDRIAETLRGGLIEPRARER